MVKVDPSRSATDPPGMTAPTPAASGTAPESQLASSPQTPVGGRNVASCARVGPACRSAMTATEPINVR